MAADGKNAGISLKALENFYFSFACVAVLLYLATPVISYLHFKHVLPAVGMASVHAGTTTVIVIGRFWLYLKRSTVFAHTSAIALGYTLVLMVSFIQILWLPSIVMDGYQEAFFTTAAFTLIGMWLMWTGGEAMGAKLREFRQSPRFNAALWAVYAVLVFVALSGVYDGYVTYGKMLFRFQDYEAGTKFNYLGLGDALACVGVLLLGTRSRTWSRVSLFLATSLITFFTFSRTSFFLFFVVGMVLLLRFGQRFRWRRRFRRTALLYLSAFLIILAAVIILVIANGALLENVLALSASTTERMTSLFTDVESDRSYQGRLQFLREQMVLFDDYWLFGRFLVEVYQYGERGTYIHNWLSFWLAFGVVPFVLSLILVGRLFLRVVLSKDRDEANDTVFALLLFALLGVTVSRSYIWVYFWLATGLAAGLKKTEYDARRDLGQECSRPARVLDP